MDRPLMQAESDIKSLILKGLYFLFFVHVYTSSFEIVASRAFESNPRTDMQPLSLALYIHELERESRGEALGFHSTMPQPSTTRED